MTYPRGPQQPHPHPQQPYAQQPYPPGQYPPPQGQYVPQQGQYAPPQGQYVPQQGQYAPPQGQHPYPYGPHAPQHPQQPQYPQPPQRPRVPARAGEGRRYLAVTIDGMIALFGGPRIFPPDAATMSGPEMFGVLVVAVVGTSLVNQYVLTLLFRGSVGKLITGIRVVRAADGGRPGPIRTLVRWLGGLCWIPLQPWYWLRDFFRMASGSRSTPRGTLGDNVEGDLYDDMAGLRYVRRKDL